MFQPHTKLHELLAHDYWIVIITNLENRFICFLRNLYIENIKYVIENLTFSS